MQFKELQKRWKPTQKASFEAAEGCDLAGR